MVKTSLPLWTQTQLKNTSHKIDPLDSKKNSPGKKLGIPTNQENEKVRAKIRDKNKKKDCTPGKLKTWKGNLGKNGYPGGLKTRKGDPGKS